MEGTEFFSAFVNALDTGALLVFVYLFATGKVMPSKTVETILQESQIRADLLGNIILDGIEAKMENAFLKALKKHNGGDKK